jgi:glutathione S-transferase
MTLLYGNRDSGHSYKVRLFLALAGLDPFGWPAVQAWLGRLAALPGWRHPSELMAG